MLMSIVFILNTIVSNPVQIESQNSTKIYYSFYYGDQLVSTFYYRESGKCISYFSVPYKNSACDSLKLKEGEFCTTSVESFRCDLNADKIVVFSDDRFLNSVVFWDYSVPKKVWESYERLHKEATQGPTTSKIILKYQEKFK